MEQKVKKVVLLDKPIWFVIDDEPELGIREILEIWGITVLCPKFENKIDREKDFTATEEYLEYLCGVSKWQSEGNHYYDDEWLAKTGEVYPPNSYMVREYCRKAKQEKGLAWCQYDTNKNLDDETDGVLGGDFITSKKLADNIREYGKVDVQF